MTDSGMVRSRLGWWVGLVLATVAGAAATWGGDQTWGATMAGIIATIFFGVIAVVYAKFSPPAMGQPQHPELDRPELIDPNNSPDTQRKSSETISISRPEPSEPTTPVHRKAAPRAGNYLHVAASSDDLLDTRNSLIECLSDSIPDEDYIEQIADEAGLDRKHLKLVGTPSNRWSAVIRRAEAEQKEYRIFERVSRLSPGRALDEAVQKYVRCRT